MNKEIKVRILLIIFGFCVNTNFGQQSTEVKDFILTDAFLRHARHRCLQQFPLADLDNFSDNHETHCYLHCFLYKSGLMDLKTRGLSNEKFLNIWENIEEAFEEDTCMERFDFSESLNGTCIETYRKLMDFRSNCLELFEYTFATNSTWKTEDSKFSKKIGQSASEFCDFYDEDNILAKETSQEQEVTLLSQYKDKLICIFENIHYLDAYGRVDESEIIMSYKEAQLDTKENIDIIKTCSHRGNCKYQQNYLGNTVLELQKCLKTKSAAYNKVFYLRDETSRQY